ncbi:MAG: hypothetical protein QOF84_4327 [Streptomyces sp.]|jgi:hypothetical protein|nr:hypothetical protein [Streptomyces sp.]
MAGVRSHRWAGLLAGAGVVLPLFALAERVPMLAGGKPREYALCHAALAPDHYTYAALALIPVAAVVAVVASVALWRRGPLAGVAGLIALVGLLVMADGLDARGETLAARSSAPAFFERSCDYPIRVYTATPGWFYP